MKNVKVYFNFYLLVAVIVVSFFVVKVTNSAGNTSQLAKNLAGKILLQVEENGEAWYVNPQTQERSFLGRPEDAFKVMREEAVGITSSNLSKIPVSLEHIIDKDSDGDKLSDDFEKAIGTDFNKKDTDGDSFDDYAELLNSYDPAKANGIKLSYDNNFANKQKGKIFLDVERSGEAWYLNPEDGKKYFLGRPSDAFELMRRKGLGITNSNLNQIVEREQGQANNQNDKIEKEKNVILSLNQAKEIASEFINTTFTEDNKTATVVSIKEENNLYVLEVEIENNTTTSYITKDGKIFFPSALDLEKMLKDRSFSNKKLTIEETKTFSQEFIDNYLMSGNEKSTILSVIELGNYNLYKLKVDIGNSDNVESYVTYNGKLFFPMAYDIDEEVVNDNQADNQQGYAGSSAVSGDLFGDFKNKLLSCESKAKGFYSIETELDMFGVTFNSKTDNTVNVIEGNIEECKIDLETIYKEFSIKNLDQFIDKNISEIRDDLAVNSGKSQETINNLINSSIGSLSEEDKKIFIDYDMDADIFAVENNSMILRDVMRESMTDSLNNFAKEYQSMETVKYTCAGKSEALLDYLTSLTTENGDVSASVKISGSEVITTYENGVACKTGIAVAQ